MYFQVKSIFEKQPQPHSQMDTDAFRKIQWNSIHLQLRFKKFYYNQTLDHFNFMPERYTTFQPKYVINFKYWGGENASFSFWHFYCV